MKRIGIVDLGSNTARLVVFGYQPGRCFRLLDGLRETVRLGEGMGVASTLTSAAIERTSAALDLFADYARATRLDRVEVLGTSALRDAEDREAVRERLADRGLGLTVLSGEEEARLAVSAVANGFSDRDAWVMDLGGGSAQIARMEARLFQSGRSFPLGAVRLTERFLRKDPPRSREVRELEAALEIALGEIAEQLGGDELPLIAVGGTVRNLARMGQRMRDYPLPILQGYFFAREELETAAERLLAVPEKERAELVGLSPDRADIIVAGALVYRWLLRRTGRSGLWISGHGVREGAFYRHFLEPPHLVEDVRTFSVRNLLAAYGQSEADIRHVRWLAGRLFDELARLHDLGAADMDLLEAAATLHRIGVVIDPYRPERQGAYLLTTNALVGFSHREQALLALLLRHQRRGNPTLGRFDVLAASGDKGRLKQLVACLRLADAMERSRAGRVRDVRVRLAGGAVELTLIASHEPTVELWEARQHEELFGAAFGRRLELRVELAGGGQGGGGGQGPGAGGQHAEGPAPKCRA